ncbi:hypothetical protein BKP56_12635 [Marinilactibacillus sp. 15R]|uniref:hypothetical protein n=1 Tax=Marinilactibacillus sp. 15R TaxID=1911586 RepID=UPI00090B79EC|nr:hypothetical protein [Marinilactibacillus sp. 15R]API90051.1 hypothetical protein BKP56_12635 [Marinilactibacillus sp. 15R]
MQQVLQLKISKNVYLVKSKHVSIGAAVIIKATAQFIEENPDKRPEAMISFVECSRAIIFK